MIRSENGGLSWPRWLPNASRLDVSKWPIPDLAVGSREVCFRGSTGSRCPGRRSPAFDPKRPLTQEQAILSIQVPERCKTC